MFPYNNKTIKNSKLYTKEKDSDLFRKFINILMIDGKKSKAFTVLWNALVYAKSILQQQSAVIKNVEYSIKSPFSLERIKTKNLVNTKTKQNTISLSKNKSTQLTNLLLDSSEPSGLLYTAIENVTPSLEVRNVRIGGRTYQVPAIIPKSRQQTIAFRWIIDSAKKRKKKNKNSFAECLAFELVDAYKKQGYAFQKRDELHKIAEANRAYIRYRWW
jgi:ribosomal protein S7